MSYIPDYYKKVTKILDVLSEQTDNYKKAGCLVAEAIKNKRLIHIIGTEMHSSETVEDVFFRTGSFANINPLFDPTFSVNHSAARSLYLKEADCCGRFLVEYYRNIQQGDLMIIVDTDGTGKACIEAVERAREMELKIIVVTSPCFSEKIDADYPYRNNNRINLCDMEGIDLVIDNKVPAFDAVINLKGLKMETGWVSTIANSFIMNAIFLAAFEIIEEENIDADVWYNFYDKEGLAKNECLIDKYIERVKHI